MMRRTGQARFATVAAIFLTAILCLAAGPTPAAADNARWGANYFPNVILTTQDGVKVHFYDEVLKAYAQKYHIGPGWTFLTGKKADIDLISKKLGLYSEPDPNDRDGHTPSVLIGNEPGGQWMRNSATDNPRFLANMIGNWLSN